jgi:hypothetical protein
LQTTLVRDCIAKHQESSPTPLFQTVAVLAKSTELLAYKVTLMSAELHILRAANKALSKCYRAKKNCIC